jgi:hypothetical protein
MAKEQRALLQAPQKTARDDETKPDGGAVVATGQQLAAWRDMFSKPIAGGPTTRGDQPQPVQLFNLTDVRRLAER